MAPDYLTGCAGVSQRHVGEHFPDLEAQKDLLLEQILEFFEEHIENRFPDPDFTFDIYITSSGKVRATDFFSNRSDWSAGHNPSRRFQLR